jgi:hypothetical protein
MQWGGNCSVVTLYDLEAAGFGETVCPARNAVGLHSIQSSCSLAGYSEAVLWHRSALLPPSEKQLHSFQRDPASEK